MSNAAKQAILQQAIAQTVAVAEAAEQQLDQAISHFDNLTQTDMEKIRKQRLDQLKQKHAMMAEWKRLGHGKYQEIADEKEWFEEAKSNKHLICHFYRGTTEYCKLLDSHLEKIAPRHMETRFVKIDAEKCNYLVERLNIRVMPTLIMTEDNYTIDRLEGFTDLGNTDRFTTEQLEERLSKRGAIEYDGPPPPGAAVGFGNDLSTSNKNNRDGKAIYESARARFMAEMAADDDDFLASTDDEAEDESKKVEGNSSAKKATRSGDGDDDEDDDDKDSKSTNGSKGGFIAGAVATEGAYDGSAIKVWK